jgi:hypothetical protein
MRPSRQGHYAGAKPRARPGSVACRRARVACHRPSLFTAGTVASQVPGGAAAYVNGRVSLRVDWSPLEGVRAASIERQGVLNTLVADRERTPGSWLQSFKKVRFHLGDTALSEALCARACVIA